MFELTKEIIFNFYLTHKDVWTKSKIDFSEKVLLETGLSIKTEQIISSSEECTKTFISACQIVRKRFQRLLDTKRVRKQKFNETIKDDIFLT